ncbi:MAG: regulatory protein RecX [Lachnospiraceae bacterium]|nr:regulatory protein RecX [Lachnospiraceae bacterium]
MTVTKIELYQKGKYKIYLNDEFAFVLYKGELKKYHLDVDEVLSEEQYQMIVEETLLKRAKLRAMYLLKDMDRSEKQLYDKLKDNGYPTEVIEAAIEYVKSYHYVDDREYARRYAEYRALEKSKIQITLDLVKKGISKEIVQEVLEDIPFDETNIIVKLVQKKCRNKDLSDLKEKQKICRFLMAKGFTYEQIRDALECLT